MSRSPAIVYYITGHGFGHARRSAEVMRELLAVRPGLTIHIRTTAPAHLFAELPAANVHLHGVALDPGAVEDDLLRVSAEKTAAALARTLGGRDGIVRREVGFLRENAIVHILADIPFLAGEVSAASGIPAIAISNFTWDWIYESLFAGGQKEMVAKVVGGYRKIPTLLKLPFGGCEDHFGEVAQCPLIASVSMKSKEVILARAGLDPADARPRILVGLRGGISDEVLRSAALGAGDFVFLLPRARERALAENVKSIGLSDELTFSDLHAVCHGVVAKLGYGIVADCIATRTALLHPPRMGFREDDITGVEAARYTRLREISPADFLAGKWSGTLGKLFGQPVPGESMRTDGAAVCAAEIARRIS
jgi:L-arabinokinase